MFGRFPYNKFASLTVTGSLVLTGATVTGGTVTKSFLIPASMFAGAVTNPADGPVQVEYGTNDVDMWFMDFHDDVVSATDPIAKSRPIPLPDGIAGSTVSVRAIWTDKNGDGASAAETIELECSMLVLGDDDAIDQAYGTAVGITDALIANDDLQTSAAQTITPESDGYLVRDFSVLQLNLLDSPQTVKTRLEMAATSDWALRRSFW